MEEVRRSVKLGKPWKNSWTSGLVKHIGICNFGTSLLRDLLSYARIRPSVLQVESHPFLVQAKLLRYCRQTNCVHRVFSSWGRQLLQSRDGQPVQVVLDNPIVQCIGMEKAKSAAQVLLRWGVRRGTSR